VGYLIFLAAFIFAFQRVRLFHDAVCALAFTLAGFFALPLFAAYAAWCVLMRALRI
jgi:hypothetical protein